MSDKNKAVIYLRRSVEDTKNKSFSLEAQQNRCQDYADKHGLTAIQVCQVIAESQVEDAENE